MRALGEHRSALRRFVGACLLVLVSLFGARASIADAPSPAAGNGVQAPSAEYGQPADAPRVGGKALELPPVPPSFGTVDGGWVHFSYPPGARERIEPLLRDADSIRAELSGRFGRAVLRNVHVRVARTSGEMMTLAPEGAPYPKYASGVAYPEIGLVLLTLTPNDPTAIHDVEEVFRHELAHVALEDAIGAGHRVPHWFNEGLAVHLSRESSLLRLRVLSTATLAGRLVPLSRFDVGFPGDAAAAELAYAESADAVRFLLRQEDRERFPALIGRVCEGQSFANALRDAYGLDLPTLEHEWRSEVEKRYSFWPVFFSGSLIWIGVLVLFALGWRRKRMKSRATLERWAREEAFADIPRARVPPALPAPAATPRVHIVLPGHEPARQAVAEVPDLSAMPPPVIDTDVPKVQHDGRWHTLH